MVYKALAASLMEVLFFSTYYLLHLLYASLGSRDQSSATLHTRPGTVSMEKMKKCLTKYSLLFFEIVSNARELRYMPELAPPGGALKNIKNEKCRGCHAAKCRDSSFVAG